MCGSAQGRNRSVGELCESLAFEEEDLNRCSLAVYISGKPFVLRDGSVPKNTLALSDRAENLEGIEDRLKSDILKEAKK